MLADMLYGIDTMAAPPYQDRNKAFRLHYKVQEGMQVAVQQLVKQLVKITQVQQDDN